MPKAWRTNYIKFICKLFSTNITKSGYSETMLTSKWGGQPNESKMPHLLMKENCQWGGGMTQIHKIFGNVV